MKLYYVSTWICCGLLTVAASALHASVTIPNPVFTTDADITATGIDDDTGLPASSPLPEIRFFTAGGASSGVFTNQVNGVAGRSGDIRTVFAARALTATDGKTFSSVRGPTGGNLILFAGLEGTLIAPGSVNFTDGKLFVVETTGGFNGRNPSTFGFPGTILATLELATAPVIATGPTGLFIAPVFPPTQNISAFDGVTIGDTDFSFLFADDGTGTFFSDISNPFSNASPTIGLHVEGEQDLQNGSGISVVPGNSAFDLDSTDLDVLNAIAAAAGLSDLDGLFPGSAFATALGGSSVSPTNEFFMDPAGLASGTGEGDLFARTNESNFIPVIEGVPEPATFMVWVGLSSFAALTVTRRRNS